MGIRENKFFVALPYIYPVCPLSIDHGRMFVIADILGRNAQMLGKELVFKVATHYSGNTAHKVAASFERYFSQNGQTEESDERIFNLYKDKYGTPVSDLQEFSNPIKILDYYSQAIIEELKLLRVSCDYDDFYDTKNDLFSKFVNYILQKYEQDGVIIKNNQGEISLNYNNKSWRAFASELLERTEFIQPQYKEVIRSAMANVRDDWNLLRTDGYGVKYKDSKIIDPMFDSELFTIFDLFINFCHKESENKDINLFFEHLFNSLRQDSESQEESINKILNFLPCDVFVCEEHLKNWVAKRMFAESYFLHSKYQTKRYFITGMGLLEGQRMSASKGRAILVKDLICDHGPFKTRLLMLLTGGHPSKIYNYDYKLIGEIETLLNNFSTHVAKLNIIIEKKNDNHDNLQIFPIELNDKIEDINKYIEKGYFRQAIIEIISIIPKNYKNPDYHTAVSLLSLYNKYLEILIPGFLETLTSK